MLLIVVIIILSVGAKIFDFISGALFEQDGHVCFPPLIISSILQIAVILIIFFYYAADISVK